MIDEHKETFWFRVEDKNLASKIKWKPVIRGLRSKDDRIILRADLAVSNFIADYLRNKLKESAKVISIGKYVLVMFSRSNKKKVLKSIPDLLDFYKTKDDFNIFGNIMKYHIGFLPKDEESLEKTIIIEPIPFVDSKKFFSAIQRLASLYDKEFTIFLCHVKFRGKSLDKLRKRFKREVDKYGPGFIIKSNQIEAFLETLFDMYRSDKIDFYEEAFILKGKKFRLEGHLDMFELQGDLKKALKFLTKKSKRKRK